MRKRETKFKSVFQSNTKTKNEIQIRFQSDAKMKNEIKTKLVSVFQSGAKTKNEIRSSNPFFNVMRKRKVEMELESHFPMP